MATEGGHVDFAPRTDQEIELLRYLRAKVGGRVSIERVLSGPGFYDLYCFLRDSGHAAEPRALAERLRGADPRPRSLAREGTSSRMRWAESVMCLALDLSSTMTFSFADLG
jgi:glucokinase